MGHTNLAYGFFGLCYGVARGHPRIPCGSEGLFVLVSFVASVGQKPKLKQKNLAPSC